MIVTASYLRSKLHFPAGVVPGRLASRKVTSPRHRASRPCQPRRGVVLLVVYIGSLP